MIFFTHEPEGSMAKRLLRSREKKLGLLLISPSQAIHQKLLKTISGAQLQIGYIFWKTP
jgi:hypothetical protein